MPFALAHLEAKLSYRFLHPEHLRLALVHKSYANERRGTEASNNERLEFLGDAVLDLIVSEELVKRFPSYPEGQLSKLRALVVNETSLSAVARDLDLGRFILLGKGEDLTGGRDKNSILANTMEAVIAALYLDSGLLNTARIVLPLLEDQVSKALERSIDFKTEFQELSQSLRGALPCYRVVSETGPDHQKTFAVELALGDEILGVGKGRSKKEAEQDAARTALFALKNSCAG